MTLIRISFFVINLNTVIHFKTANGKILAGSRLSKLYTNVNRYDNIITLMLKNIKSKKFLLLSLLAILVLAGGGLAAQQLLKKDEKKLTGNSQPNENSQEATGVADKNDSEQPTGSESQNPAIVNREQQTQNQQQRGDDRKLVKPVITYAGQYGGQVEVGGYVPGVFEDGGTCTAKFTNGGKTITKSVNSVKNVNSNDCPVMIAKNEEFSPRGTWSVTITYESTIAAGTSDPKSIEVK